MHGKIPKDMMIDHVNGVRVDNVPNNLRLATKSDNCNNRGSNSTKSFSEVPLSGVNWDDHSKFWSVQKTTLISERYDDACTC